MGLEIERKYLVTGDAWRTSEGKIYRQGYLTTDPYRTVRVRIAGDQGQLTIKGASQGASRAEYEYEIPISDASEILDHLCQRPLIEKCRHRITYGGLVWEVDEFFGENAGLVVAEIELEQEDQPFDLPAWVGNEVTSDARYYNANLVTAPYSTWRHQQD